MKKRPNPELIDDDNPEWTDEDFRNARPAKEVISPELYAGLIAMNRRAGVRGPQKAPVKERVTLRLSPEIVRHFRATGRGWQTRINDALNEWVSRRAGA